MLHQNLIGGSWVGSAGGANVNPSDTNDIVGDYAVGTEHDMVNAINAARDAFPSWSQSSILDRHAILRKVADEIFARKDELGYLLAREEGKTLAEGIGETVRAGMSFDLAAGEALRLTGEKLPSVRPGVSVDVSYEPLGVVGLITPWNFPMAIPAWKIAPALCYGNTVVFKPAELVPGCAWALVDILQRAGVPEGVVNLVMGKGSVVGQAILDSHDVDAISFTGSNVVGRSVAETSSTRMRRYQLEMGGKNPFVVLDDADLDTAVNCVLNGAFFSTGQRCTASSRVIVTDEVHDRFVDALRSRMDSVIVDNAVTPGTEIGPVVDQRQFQQDLEYIEIGKKDGANLVHGGEPLTRKTPGFYLQPALFTECENSMRICQEEIFGPVCAVIRVRDYEEALSVANDNSFGLTAGICTISLKYAEHFKRNARAGMVMVNVPTAGVDFHVPFGGIKGSSFGSREQGRYARDFFTETKTAYTCP